MMIAFQLVIQENLALLFTLCLHKLFCHSKKIEVEIIKAKKMK